ncbi:MAG: hypothetical protein QXF76_02750 [Candidatus Anstonellales archaeon]
MYLEIFLYEEGVQKILIINKETYQTLQCDVEHIEGERYKVVTNIEQAIEMLKHQCEIKIIE